MTTCIFFGCDNELPNLPKGYGAGQWPVGWCEECNDKKRGHDTPDHIAREVIAETLDGFMTEPYTYIAATDAILTALRDAGLKFTK